MKQKDILIIATVAIAAGIISFLIANLLFGGTKSYNLKSPQVDTISSDFVQPSSQYFKPGALNPTKEIIIGQNNNTKPFGSGAQ